MSKCLATRRFTMVLLLLAASLLLIHDGMAVPLPQLETGDQAVAASDADDLSTGVDGAESEKDDLQGASSYGYGYYSYPYLGYYGGYYPYYSGFYGLGYPYYGGYYGGFHGYHGHYF